MRSNHLHYIGCGFAPARPCEACSTHWALRHGSLICSRRRSRLLGRRLIGRPAWTRPGPRPRSQRRAAAARGWWGRRAPLISSSSSPLPFSGPAPRRQSAARAFQGGCLHPFTFTSRPPQTRGSRGLGGLGALGPLFGRLRTRDPPTIPPLRGAPLRRFSLLPPLRPPPLLPSPWPGGSDEEEGSCEARPCPVATTPTALTTRRPPTIVLRPRPIAHWTEWADWSLCQVTCGPGRQLRRRICVNLSFSSQV